MGDGRALISASNHSLALGTILIRVQEATSPFLDHILDKIN